MEVSMLRESWFTGQSSHKPDVVNYLASIAHIEAVC